MSKNIVFLSHSSRDKKQLIPFRKALEERTNGTIQFFLSSDGQSIPLGHNWVASVEHSLDEAKLAFVFLTANSVGSSWVAFEAGFMHSKKIRVIPVALPGIELGQVSPPLGLLQGFNMHSHEAMNNVFEILNQEFQHQHKPSFTAEDFRKFFGADSELGSGFFGEYSAMVNKIVFEGKAKEQPVFPRLKEELQKLKITLAESAESSQAHAPGLFVETNQANNWFRITLHSEIFTVALPTVCSVMQQVEVVDAGATVDFLQGVTGGGWGVHVTGRAYGTEFLVRADGCLKFRRLSLNHGVGNPLFVYSTAAFDFNELRDLIVTLFECEMLKLKSVQQNTDLGQLLSVLQVQRLLS